MRFDTRVVWRLCLALVFTTLIVGGAGAQGTLGRIAGVARDQSGAVLPGATVTVINEATNLQRNGVTSGDGGFLFPQLAAGSYTVKIEMPGFKVASFQRVKVDAGQEYSLAARLEVGRVEEVVEVTAGADLVHTTSTEIANTVEQRQILELPLNGRNPIELIRLQAGVVGIANRTNTAVNGGRPTWTQVTMDGINIQDNFIRTNSLDFVPNRPVSDNVAEFSIITNTQGADSAGGASQVRMISPAGGNEFHGSVYEFNRDSALSANSFFNNSSGVAKPSLRRNQFGGRASGPILKDKLFFSAYYEGFRQVTEQSRNNVIPATPDLLSGVFRHVRSDGGVGAVNVMQLSGLSIDPRLKTLLFDRIPASSLVNNYNAGNSRADRILNTAGYRINQTRNTRRNYLGGRLDWQAAPSHHLEAVLTRLTDVDDRPDLDTIHESKLLAFTDATTRLLVGAWHWTVSPRLRNELRVGANLAPVAFETREDYGDTLFNTQLGLLNPVVTFQPQGRNTRTYQFIDNASLVTRGHSLQFGASLQAIRVRPYNYAGRFPTVNFGFSAAAPASVQLSAAQFPGGISAADLASANALLAMLSGTITSVARTFQVSDRTSGFVAGIPNQRNYSLDDWSVYVQDSWRVRPNLTLRAGLKWEYFTPVKEDDGLALAPVLNGRSAREALLDPSGRVDFANGGLWGRDLGNLGPSVGFAWDPFKNGKTSVRGAYTLTFVNEEAVTVATNASGGNAGLQTAVTLTNQYTTVSRGVPAIPTPAFLMPRTYLDQLAASATSTAWINDPNLKQPKVHQISFSIERELGWDTAVEARYVATLGRDIVRGIDVNQINAGGEFQQDFLRARNNGFLALAATGSFDPAFNAAVAGSQALTVIPRFGLLTNATVRSLIQTGEPGSLADFYVTNRVAGASAAFFPNPNIYAANLVINGGSTDYHSLQLEARRRFRNGVFAQANYTFGKVLTNSAGTAQSRLEPFLDNARPELERSRADFHVTHVVNGNLIFELPVGKGKRFFGSSGLWDRILGGWQVSNIVHWQSGSPFSIRSGRGTFNRGGRSGNNTANSSLTPEQIRGLIGLFKAPDGRLYFIDPKVIDPSTGRAVGADNQANTAAFSGQAFFNPGAGTLGSVQRLQFDGPPQFTWDMSLIKRVRLKGKWNAELRGDAFNILNHPSFSLGDQDINSTTFGRITAVNVGARVIQVSAKLNF